MYVVKRAKTVVVTNDVYVAFDGTEFDSEVKCLAYEASLKEKSDETVVESLKRFDYSFLFAEDNYHWAYVTNEEELQSFVRYWLHEDEREYWDYTDPERDKNLRLFPLWVVAIVDDDGYGGVYNANNVLSSSEDFIEAVREQIKAKDTETEEKQDDET